MERLPDRGQYVDIARAIGTAGLGVAAGWMGSISAIHLPSLVCLSPLDRLRVWSSGFDRAARLIPRSLIISTALLGSSAYHVPEGFGTVGAHRRIILASAAAATFACIPFTMLVMIPNIKWLKKELHAGNAGRETDAAIRRWERQHKLRTFLVTSAFIAAIVELLSC
ncbi:hypothetical protein AURDEDRAFT_113187 [Auricularia subglabra TFB-10046 SS5]|nr:hypothetical protein AURDEDRAFT_113187 [Auricularia subglabra TFB-10046 SS5]